jgi:hypothetical protein
MAKRKIPKDAITSENGKRGDLCGICSEPEEGKAICTVICIYNNDEYIRLCRCPVTGYNNRCRHHIEQEEINNPNMKIITAGEGVSYIMNGTVLEINEKRYLLNAFQEQIPKTKPNTLIPSNNRDLVKSRYIRKKCARVHFQATDISQPSDESKSLGQYSEAGYESMIGDTSRNTAYKRAIDLLVSNAQNNNMSWFEIGPGAHAFLTQKKESGTWASAR